MELGAMIHFGEMCQLVADDVSHKLFGHKHKVGRELNYFF